MSASEKNTIEMEQKLKDITHCGICLETYREPRILPCIHTFCLSCLKEAGAKTNRCPGDKLACPICRKEFTIPEEGLIGLQKNLFIDRLVEISKMLNPSVARILCDLCSEDVDNDVASEFQSAEVYCVDCHQKLCQDCCRHHRKSKLSKFHKIIDLEDQMITQEFIESALPTFCAQHNGKAIEIYCSVCHEVLCAICFIEFHKTHDGSPINNIVDDFREQIQKSTESFSTCVYKLMEKRKVLENDMIEYLQKTEDIEIEVNSAREELKQVVNEHSECLILQLRSLKQKRLKDTEMQKDEIETLVASLESLETYCKQITTIGSASDICRGVTNLKKRAEELNHMFKTTEQIGVQLKHIALSKTDMLKSDNKNIIGHIEDSDREVECSVDHSQEWSMLHSPSPSKIWSQAEPECARSTAEEACRGTSYDYCDQTEDRGTKDSKNCKCDQTKGQLMKKAQDLEQQLELLKQKEMERERVTKKLSKYNPTPRQIKEIRPKMASTGSVTVTGLAILDNELFIATRNSNDINVYDSKSYDFKRLWCVSMLRDPWDLCSCSRRKCLYVAFGHKCNDTMRFKVSSTVYSQPKETTYTGKILRVDHNGNLQHSWLIGDDYGTLSNTVEGNIILTIPVRSKIIEYSTNGECVREINISTAHNLLSVTHSKWNYSYFICPTHAQKLPTGNFVVNYFGFESSSRYLDSYCDYKNDAGLCITNAEGEIINVFQGKSGPGFGELCEPWYLAVDKDLAVLVLERRNKRISLLNPNLEYKRKLVSKKHGLSNPYRMCLDEENGRLLVANSESVKDHVLAYDNYQNHVLRELQMDNKVIFDQMLDAIFV